MRLNTGYEDRKGRIEIVPLIDIIFLLLVFFLYAMVSMTVQRGVRVTLPGGTGTVEPASRLVVTLTVSNTYLLDGRPLALPDLVREVEVSAAGTNALVLIRGDRAADLGAAVELLARLRERGAAGVTFQVQPQEP
jgi:biopolymer transport protein ExbD